MARAIDLNEHQLDELLTPAWFERHFRFRNVLREVPLGAYRFDRLASDADGRLVVVELKTDAHLRTLGQLLVYRHAVAKHARSRQVRALLLTTYLDKNVVEVVDQLRSVIDIELKVCKDDPHDPDGLVPVDPRAAGPQVWYQDEVGKHRDLPLPLKEGQGVPVEAMPELSGYLGVVANPEALTSVEWQHLVKDVWAGRYGSG